MKSVVSGQQVGLFGGPLFVVYKIIGVLKKAEESKKERLRPVFWLETNDADFDEIKHYTYLTEATAEQGKKVTQFTWGRSSGGKCIGHVEVDKALVEFMTDYLEALPDTVYKNELCEVVKKCFALGTPLGEANQLFFEWVFADYPVEFFNPQSDDFIAFSQPYLKKELERTKVGEQANAFAIYQKKRWALFRKEGGWATRKGRTIDLGNTEVYLAPNLQTRSVIQDAYFNNAYYIAGPSEAVYLKQLTSQYEFHGVTPAKVVPRMKATLITSAVQKQLGELVHHTGFTAEYFTEHCLAEVKKEMLDRRDIHLATLKKELILYKNDLVKEGLMPRSEEKNFYDHIKHFVGGMRKRSFKHAELKLVEAVVRELFPSPKSLNVGVRQERLLGILPYLNEYGKAMIDTVYQSHEFGEKILIYLGNR